MYSEYNITEEVNNSILTIFQLDLHRRVQRCGTGDAVVQLNCTPSRADVIMLTNLYIILLKFPVIILMLQIPYIILKMIIKRILK